jgi:hypothetical protein
VDPKYRSKGKMDLSGGGDRQTGRKKERKRQEEEKG